MDKCPIKITSLFKEFNLVQSLRNYSLLTKTTPYLNLKSLNSRAYSNRNARILQHCHEQKAMLHDLLELKVDVETFFEQSKAVNEKINPLNEESTISKTP